MDTSERDSTASSLAVVEQSLTTTTPGAEAVARLVDQWSNLRTQLAQFVPEHRLSPAQVEEWRRVSAELRQSQKTDESYQAQSTLPKVLRTQDNRFRLEEEDLLIVRQPFFSSYETAVLESQALVFGLTGPGGFGKSAFLHYFCAKYCYGESNCLVVYVPACPTEETALKRLLATAFYRGCQIAGLTGYKQLKLSSSLAELLNECIDFSSSREKRLLLVVDQMETKPQAFFDSTTDAMRNLGGEDFKVIMSSSVSNKVAPIFGSRVYHLDRYSHKITPQEAGILASITEESSTLQRANLARLPFQVAAEIVKGRQASLCSLASPVANYLLGNPHDPSSHFAFFHLQMAADSTKKDSEQDCEFGSTLSGDFFYVDSDGDGRFFIAEHREGFAAEILAIMRVLYGDYEQYLLQVLGNVNFLLLDAGARGRIIEDCFAIIFRSNSAVRLPFLKIPELSKPSPAALALKAGPQKNFLDIDGGDEAVPSSSSFAWPSTIEVYVFIPLNRRYKGIDFIIARKTGNTLYIYFVQCTILWPQEHPIIDSELYEQWQALLTSSSGVRKCNAYLVFMTPHSTNLSFPGPASLATYFRAKTKLHVRFANIEGEHPLLAKIKERFDNL